jgi:hypothetical protein
MKKFIRQLKSNFTSRVKNERGQGMLEYILLLVVVVALVMVFKDKIKSAVEAKVGDLSSSIGSFSGN